MAQPPKQDPRAAAAEKERQAAERERAAERDRQAAEDEHDRVSMPGRGPQAKMSDDQEGEVGELTKTEQEAGKETLKNFGEQLKAEQELGQKLVKQSADLAKSKAPRALPPPQSGSRANPLHG